MTPLGIALAVLAPLTLGSVALAIGALYQARSAARAAARPAAPDLSAFESAVQSLRTEMEGIAAQVHTLQELPVPSAGPLAARNGLNLAKRAQALRLHRHGNPPGQIASILEIPLQEVELLLKVHQIVMSNLPN